MEIERWSNILATLSIIKWGVSMRVAASAPNAEKEMSMQTCSTRYILKLRRYSSISNTHYMQQPQYLSSHTLASRQKGIFEETSWQSHVSSQQDQRLSGSQPSLNHPKRKDIEQIRRAHSSQLDCQQSLQAEKNQRTPRLIKDDCQNH